MAERQEGRQAVRKRRLKRALVAGLVLGAAGVLSVYADVLHEGTPILRDRSALPPMPVAIVFGAGYTKFGPSPVLYDRVATAVELYKAGKVRKLLMTGDNGRRDHNEPVVMQETAERMGVPAADIALDYAGFRTYDSLYRARDIFGVRRAYLVSQTYHLPRALFLARKLGLTAIGVPAEKRGYGRAQTWFNFREALAVEAAWFDANIRHPRPTFLGKKEPLFPAPTPKRAADRSRAARGRSFSPETFAAIR
jgi:vancomycin permeability regulator SanA